MRLMKGMHINYKHWSTKQLKRDKQTPIVSIDIANIAGLNNIFRNLARKRLNKVEISIYGDPGLATKAMVAMTCGMDNISRGKLFACRRSSFLQAHDGKMFN